MRDRVHVRPCAQCLHGNVHVIGTWDRLGDDMCRACARMKTRLVVLGSDAALLCVQTCAGADLIQRGWVDCENGSRAFVIRQVARPAVM